MADDLADRFQSCSDDLDFDACNDEKLKVRIRQSEDGRKKKIKVENEFMKITIRVRDKEC